VIVGLRGSRQEADREYDTLLESYRSGALRLVDPAGIVLRREACHRERVPA
jgi:hypothetical protein